MKKTVKQVAGAAAAASTLAVLTPAPAYAHDPAVGVHKYFGNHLQVSLGAAHGVGPDVHVRTFGTYGVVDANYPIVNQIPNECSLGPSDDPARPYRAVCSGITDRYVSVYGTDAPDTIWVDVPGHESDVWARGGADRLTGGPNARDFLRGGLGADTIFVNHPGDPNRDVARCGSDADDSPDGAVDHVYYNGTDTTPSCGAIDVLHYSSK